MDAIILAIPSIKGACKLESELGTDTMQIHSYSHGVAMEIVDDRNGATGTVSRTAGRAHFNSMQLVKTTDLATPALYTACAEGNSLSEVKLAIGRTEGGKFVSEILYTLGEVLVESISTSGGAGSAPTDVLSLAYVQIQTTFTQQKTDTQKGGKAAFGWHRAKNTATE